MGEVIIAGAGPGNPLLISLQLLEELKRADVIIYDRLIHPEILRFARKDAEKIFAGKEAKRHYLKQYEINDLLIEKARKGKRVLRIQGGDPVIFGRTGEELEKLNEAGIRYRLIPGITAGIAAPEYAGIPLTHRRETSAVMFITGHEDPEKKYPAIDWDHVAAFTGTLIIYMGVSNLDRIVSTLIEKGKSPDTPVAMIQNGTFYNQKVIHGTLKDIVEIARREKIAPPAITVVGGVARYVEQNRWFEKLPFYGLKIAVLRGEDEVLDVARKIWYRGGEAAIFPVIKFEKKDFSVDLPRICDYSVNKKELVVFTSPRGVKFFFEGVRGRGLDIRCLGFRRIAAIGPSTRDAVESLGLRVDIVPDKYVAESLADSIMSEKPERVFILRAERAREVLPEMLQKAGIEVKVIPVYRTLIVEHSPEEIEGVLTSDFFLFSSSSTFENFVRMIGDPFRIKGKIVSIGPVTTSTIKKYGLEPVVESETHTIDGVIASLESYIYSRREV